MLGAAFPRNRGISTPKASTFNSNAGRSRVFPATGQRVTEAVEALRRAKVIALPTDTLYGLAASACSEESIKRLYDAKHRSSNVPLAICVGDAEDVRKYADVAHLSTGLLEELLPGPVTILLQRKKKCDLSASLNPGVQLLGIRVPDSDFVRAVSRQYGHAIALTSANESGALSTLAVQEFSNLWNECALVFDGGSIPSSRLGSTIVNLSVPGEFIISRRGDSCDSIQGTLEKYGITRARDDDR